MSTCVAFKGEIELNHVSSLQTKREFDKKNDVRPRFNIIYWWKDGRGIVKAELEFLLSKFLIKGNPWG